MHLILHESHFRGSLFHNQYKITKILITKLVITKLSIT